METLFGVKWPEATSFDVGLLFVLIIIVVIIYALMRNYYIKKNKKLKIEEQFLYKTLQFGLTGKEFRILNDIKNLLSLKDPNQLISKSSLFESAIPSFLGQVSEKNEIKGAFSSICRDVIITHEKLYRSNSYKRPLENIFELEPDSLIYFVTEDKTHYISKFSGDNNKLILQVYNKDIRNLLNKNIKGFDETKLVDSSKRFSDVENWYTNTKRVWN